MHSYRTIEEIDDRVETLYEIQKSKFITHLRHVDTEEEAREFITAIKKRYFDARHNCSAYVLGEKADKQKSNDDGEPGGTAGLPMMEVLKNRGVVNCCVVVVRYFGGILLGTGGLVRAYTQGCKAALQAAGFVRMELSSVMRCTVSYSLWSSVQYTLQKMPVQVMDLSYAEDVSFTLAMRKKDSDDVEIHLRNLTDGKLSCEPVSEVYLAWDP